MANMANSPLKVPPLPLAANPQPADRFEVLLGEECVVVGPKASSLPGLGEDLGFRGLGFRVVRV